MKNCLLAGTISSPLLARCQMYYDTVDILTSGAEVRQRLNIQSYSCVMIQTPLIDEFGDMLARYAASDPYCLVVLWVKKEMVEELAQTMENVYVCNMLYDMDEWESLMHFLSVTCQKLDIIRAQKEDLMKKIDEIRLVDRAKCLLIEKFHYSEEKAHYTIEKKAMDNRLSRLQVAQIIIRHIEKEE